MRPLRRFWLVCGLLALCVNAAPASADVGSCGVTESNSRARGSTLALGESFSALGFTSDGETRAGNSGDDSSWYPFAGAAKPACLAEATNLFTTIGITRSETRANGQIYPPTNPYSLPAEQMPPSGTVGAAPNDGADDVPLRMPDTSGTKPNLAAMRGQVLTLRPSDQKAYAKLHFFGTTSDGGPAGGDFTLTYDDGTATVNVQWPDWCGNASASAHFAIGKLTMRYRATGSDSAACGIYHYAVENPQPAKKLVSITLPPATAPAGGNTQAYLMALTLEEPGGLFELPDLSGQLSFPDDNTAPITTLALDPAAPNGEDGWYAGAVRVTLDASDEQGGSGVEQMMYRIDGGAPQNYSGPFAYAVEGTHTFEYRSIDGAGNAENYKAATLKVDAHAPTTSARQTPETPAGDWYDGAVTVRLNAADGAGSGVQSTEYRLDGGAWTAYAQPVVVEHTQTLEYRSNDVAGNTEAARSLTLRVDKDAPVTTLRINGAAPLDDYTGAVRVTFTRDDNEGSGVVKTEYRLDESDWTAYAGAFDVSANRGHKLQFRSVDAAGNAENFQTKLFTIRPPTPQAAPLYPQATPAPKPKKFAALSSVKASKRSVSVRVSCQGVSKGTLRLVYRRKTLASRTLKCDEGRATATLTPHKLKKAIQATVTLRFSGVAQDTQTVTVGGSK